MADDVDDQGSLSDAIREQIRRAILEGELTPGTRLAEQQLAAVYGVGRSTIRGVLRALASDRVVELSPNRGARVATPDEGEARRLFDLRRALEGYAIERAAHVARTREVLSLQSLVEAQRASLEARTPKRNLALIGDFHVRASALAANQEITAILAPLVERTSLIIAAFGGQRAVANAPDSHDEILSLVAEGRPSQAARSVERCLYRFQADIDFRREISRSRPIELVLSSVR